MKLLLFLFAFISFFSFSQTYTEVDKLVASDRNERDRFGQDVDIYGNYAVVGAYGEGNGTGLNKGAVYIYENQGGNWVQIQKITASDDENYDRFGWSVAIDDSLIVVGAYAEDDDLDDLNSMSKAGAAYIIELDQTGTWVEQAKVIASDRSAGDEFGYSVDIQNGTVVVGAHFDYDDYQNLNPIHRAGSVYIFDKDLNGDWVETQKLTPLDRNDDLVYPNGRPDPQDEELADQFGNSVGICGDYLIVGALHNDYDVNNANQMWTAGSAYVFERSGGVWTEVQKLNNSDRDSWDRFGAAVAIDTNVIAIGVWSEEETPLLKNAGSVYIFERDLAGTWLETQKILPNDQTIGDHFGWDVKLDGNYLISGTEHDDHDENTVNSLHEAGSAYIFEKNGAGTWNQLQKIDASDRDSLDIFGYAVGISGNSCIVGAFQHDWNLAHEDSLHESGTAYIFNSCATPILTTTDTTICFGTTLAVGDSTYDSNGSYTNNFLTQSGCDSVVTTNVTISAEITSSQTVTICDGDSYSIGSSTYSTENTFSDILTSILSGCDSTVSTTIEFYPDLESSQTINICDGDSYSIGSSTYSTEGTFDEILTSVITGCDSTVHTTIAFYPQIIVNQSFDLCGGESVTVGTSTYTTVGNYTDVLTSVITGCDSTINTDIIESTGFEITQNITICHGETYIIGNSNYSVPGNFVDTLAMFNGNCDSIVHTNLTINLPLDLSLDVNGNDIESNQNNAFYQWVDCDDNYGNLGISAENDQELTIMEDGTYAVILNQNGCIDTSACVYVNFVGLSETNSSIVNIYPNPSSGIFTVHFNVSSYSITVLNQLGEEVFNKFNLTENNQTVNLYGLPKGVYFINLKSDDLQVTRKVIIQ
jgi:hypothetical protein